MVRLPLWSTAPTPAWIAKSLPGLCGRCAARVAAQGAKAAPGSFSWKQKVRVQRVQRIWRIRKKAVIPRIALWIVAGQIGRPGTVAASPVVAGTKHAHEARPEWSNLVEAHVKVKRVKLAHVLKLLALRTVFGLTGELGEIAPSLVVAEIRVVIAT